MHHVICLLQNAVKQCFKFTKTIYEKRYSTYLVTGGMFLIHSITYIVVSVYPVILYSFGEMPNLFLNAVEK